LLYTFFTPVVLASAVSPFQNLDFDGALTNRANLEVSPPGWGTSPSEPGLVWISYAFGLGSTSDLLPGWTLTHGGDLVTNMTFNLVPADVDYAVLYDVFGTGRRVVPYPPEGGSGFALSLGFTHSQPYELTQSGELPGDVRFLSYDVVQDYFEVRVQDELLQPISFGGYFYLSTRRVLIFDISKFAGQTVKLALRQSGNFYPFDGTTVGYSYLDGITVVTQLPTLQISASGTQLILTWPASATDFALQSRDALSPQAPWQVVTQAPVVVGDQKTVTVDKQGPAKIFRLSLGGY
jgi:hypothetical protein